MKDVHEKYCARCGYDFERGSEEEEESETVGEDLKKLVFRLTGFVL